ncbi:polymer-forming cytoskeletal protein [Ideonella sp.]|uniref:polymer-forming cytoskeletal protein n=1 Tax=Ideonella sp. TaxID=1929293 RepID=UPI002B4A49E9|nr:polymer-forming cytoskeletal protein [Ideonella sp.]HJV69014.1 polymer-forming cytoskeletal protein [Ideonella sp.]
MKSWITAIAIGAACAICGAAAADEHDGVAARDLGTDRAIAGGAPSQMQPVAGDLMAAGGTVEVLAEVGGDALLLGGTLRLDAAVRQSLYAAGGRVTIGAPVQHNARIAGGSLEVSPAGRVAGNLSAAGGELRVLGPVDGYVVAGAGRVLINAPVAGDVHVRAGRLELGPRAAIGGKLRYASGDEIVRDPAARVGGGIERVPRAPSPEPGRHRGAVGWVWTAGLMLLAAVLAAALPRLGERVQRSLSERPGASALAGFVAIVCVPVLAIVLLATVIGAPLGLLALLAYPALLLVGYASLGVSGGRMALARWKPQRQAHRGWQALAAALCMLLIGLAAAVPWLGGLVALVVLVLGVGSVLLAAQPGASAAA